MQTKIRNILLNITALTGLFAGFYPAVILFRYLYFKDKIVADDLFLDLALLFAGFAVSVFIFLKDDPKTRFIAYLSIREFTVYLSLLIPVASAIAVYMHLGVWRTFLEAVIAFALYYIGLNALFMEFIEILSGQKILYGTIALSFSLFIVIYFLEESGLKSILFAFGYVFLIASLILKNQDNLERIFTAGNKIEFSVPKYIRSYNALGIVLIFLTILLIFYLKPAAIALLQIIWAVIRYFLWLIYKLLSLLKMESAQGHQTDGGLPELPEGEGNPAWDILFAAVLILMFAYAAFKWGPRLFKTVIRGMKRLLQYCRRLFKNLEKPADSIEYYVDEDSFVKPEGKLSLGILGKFGHSRKNTVNLRSITDPVLRVRAFFRLVLESLNKGKIEIKQSDTANEILLKSLKIEQIQPDFAELTDLYESVRYGDEIPDQTVLSKAESWYRNIVSAIKNERKTLNG